MLSNVSIILGKNDAGIEHSESLQQLGNILIGGETGSGKSTFNHQLIQSLSQNHSAKDLKIYLADPKRVEFGHKYQDLPNLFSKIAEEPEQILLDLESVSQEKERRLQNDSADNPFIVIIIDTFSDLSSHDKSRFEKLIKNLTSDSQKSKIFVIMCDSRVEPSLFNQDLLACFETKIAFRTTTNDASKILIGQAGAETLKGKGEMIVANQKLKLFVQLQN